MEGRLQDRCQLCSEVRLAAVRAAVPEHIAEVPAAGIRPVVAHSSEAVRRGEGLHEEGASCRDAWSATY